MAATFRAQIFAASSGCINVLCKPFGVYYPQTLGRSLAPNTNYAPTFCSTNVLCKPTGASYHQTRILAQQLARADILLRQCTLQTNRLAPSLNKNFAAEIAARRRSASLMYSADRLALTTCKQGNVHRFQTRIPAPPLARANILLRKCSLQTNRLAPSFTKNSAADIAACRRSAAPMYPADQSAGAIPE